MTIVHRSYRDLLIPAGILLLASGSAILLDQRLHTGWLSQAAAITAGLLILAGGLWIRSLLGILAGGLLTSLSAGGFFLLGGLDLAWNGRLGSFLMFFGAGWLVLFIFALIFLQQRLWWMVVPGGLFTSLGASFLFTTVRILDVALYLGVGTALPLLAWGASRRLIGLIIPGCLLLGSTAGVYLGWESHTQGSALAHTGIMLVVFGLGWLLITVLSRVITTSIVWWPLIPGGILAVVGWGLYIGGDPGNAISFISNTGSIALILFGIYLLLLRRGIQ